MICKLVSTNDAFPFDTITNHFVEDYLDVLDSSIRVFDDIIFTIFNSVPLKNNLILNLESITEYYFSFIRKYIDSKFHDSILFSIETTDSGSVIRKKEISFAEVLLSVIEDEEDSPYAKIGAFIASMIQDYCKRSQWHLGIQHKDDSITILSDADIAIANIAWFGPSNEPPNKKWIIRNNSIEGSVFECTDCWDIIEYLVDDCNDAFLIWYTMECGFWYPDTIEILKDCPIPVNEQ